MCVFVFFLSVFLLVSLCTDWIDASPIRYVIMSRRRRDIAIYQHALYDWHVSGRQYVSVYEATRIWSYDYEAHVHSCYVQHKNKLSKRQIFHTRHQLLICLTLRMSRDTSNPPTCCSLYYQTIPANFISVDHCSKTFISLYLAAYLFILLFDSPTITDTFDYPCCLDIDSFTLFLYITVLLFLYVHRLSVIAPC